jgi:hypothetical protein
MNFCIKTFFRYYDAEELCDRGVEHKKIMTAGHMIPSHGVIADFFSTVDAFLARDDTSIIGKLHTVHLYLPAVFFGYGSRSAMIFGRI